MKKDEKLNSYMAYLREEFDKICLNPDKTIEEKAHRNVCKDMFDGLTYGINDSKLEQLRDVLEDYIIIKEKRIQSN